MSGPLAGRSALITGASHGLGLEIARAFIGAGASVFLCGRQRGPLEEASAALAEGVLDGQQIATLTCDVADAEQVTSLVAAAIARFPDLSILVSNAGIYGPMGNIESVSWEEWRRTVEVNLFGSVALAREIVPHLRARNRGGKIIQLSGGGATSPMPGISAYAASKSAVVRFAESLALEVADASIDVNAVAPGAMNTRMLDEVIQAGPERVGRSYYDRSLAQRESGGVPPTRGAELCVWLASAASDGITGKLISAVWDPYEEFGAHREELAGDIYTLRRIVPEDRGLDWGG